MRKSLFKTAALVLTFFSGLSASALDQVDGVYQIGTPQELTEFAQLVNEGNSTINAVLTKDIDLTDVEFPMIGNSSISYSGTFDGQYHTVTLNQTASQSYYGLFGTLQNATIKNLRTAGDINTAYNLVGGICGYLISSKIQNCVSSVNINSSIVGDAATGGICGWTYGSEVTNSIFNGSITGEAVINCGGFSGWATGPATTSFTNCAQIGQINIAADQGDTYNVSRAPEAIVCTNVYYLNSTKNTNPGTIQITADQLASGEACYILNGDQTNIRWTQTIDDSMTLFPFPGKQVFKCGDNYVNVETDEEFANFKEYVIDYESEFCENLAENVIAKKDIVEQYKATVEKFDECTSLEEFVAIYNTLPEQKNALQKSEEAYNNYMGKVNEAKTYLEENTGLEGPAYEKLLVYLSDYEEPSNTYFHGTLSYILEVAELNEEELKEEMYLIDEMLFDVTLSNTQSGTDVTTLITNPDFSDGFEGWDGQLPTSFGSSETSPIRAAVCEGKTMDMYQTIYGLQNGIYELRINGAFSPYPIEDYNNTNYAAMLYANGNVNYFQANIEDMLPVSEAVDGQNCYLAGDNAVDVDENIIGYTMNGVISCCNAFQAGRYENAILANVTNGTLKIGIKQPGTGNSPEWLGFGNIKLIYGGTLEQADESLTHVLESQTARANTILNIYEFSAGDDYKFYPNFSQKLKDDLKAVVDSAKTVSNPHDKYALIERFTDLFQKIYENKKDYIKFWDQYFKVENLLSYNLDEDETNELDAILQSMSNDYVNGTVSQEDIEKDYLSMLSFMPQKQSDGYVHIGTAKDLVLFAVYTNMINPTYNAMLTADIDLTDVDFPMIGTSSNHYSGIFDGQNHTITLKQTATQSYYGLFCILNGATIKNLRTAGEIHTSFNIVGGICGQMILSTIQNCISSVDIISNSAIDAAFGGITGWIAEGSIVKDCVYNGKILAEASVNCGGFAGWSGGTKCSFINCLQMGEIAVADPGDTYNVSRNPGVIACSNVYYLNSVGNVNEGTIQITPEQLTSGEVCFQLNGNQSDIQWTQTIGEDDNPIPFPTRKTVYAEGAVRCDGKITGDVVFTNTPCTLPEHEFEDGVCINCGYVDPIKLVDGFYHISNANQLIWFANKVNSGENYINAKLTADIDLTDKEFPMIGTSSIHYSGIFDGQSHTITLNQTATQSYYGLFCILNGATIKNLRTAGEIQTAFNLVGGICGQMLMSKLQNCVSSVNIISSFAGDAATGGITGWTYASEVENCVFNGSIRGELVMNCGGFAGWSTGKPVSSFTNCLQIGEINIAADQGDTYNVSRNPGEIVCTNVYCLNPTANSNEGTIQITKEQLISGELCFLLNGDQTNIRWTQTIGEDANPIPFLSRETVYAEGAVRCDGIITGDVVFSNTPCALPEHQYKDGVCVNCGQTLPIEIVDGFYLISNVDHLLYFANKVNNGENTINAKLNADIDLTGIKFPMIGTSSIHYSGIFDGQYHTVTLNQTATQSYYGLFSILNSATIKNLRTTGEIHTAFNLVGGICGQTLLSTIQNCISSVNIISSFTGDGALGGITGWTYGSVIENCLFNGSIVGDVVNCGGFAGWSTGSEKSFINNCLQIGEISIAADQGDTYNLSRNPGEIVCTNVYYLNPTAFINEGTIQITAEQLANGEICYLLNGNQTNTQWTQTLGEDSYPIPFSTRKTVNKTDDGTYTNEGNGLLEINNNTKNADVYNLMGQKVGKAQRGIFIIDGQKILKK